MFIVSVQIDKIQDEFNPSSVKFYNIDTVIHFAAQSHVQTSFTDSLQYTKDNVIVVSGLANKIKTSATPEQIKKVADFYASLYKEKGIV